MEIDEPVDQDKVVTDAEEPAKTSDEVRSSGY